MMSPELLSLENSFGASTLSKIDHALFDRQRIELWIKRDDLLHPIISGNKWRKLKYSLQHALSINADTIVSMGGAYSNHLHALAYVGQCLGLKTVGLVRGDTPSVLTPTLQDAHDWGMKLRFVSRSDYRQLRRYCGGYDLPGIQPGHYWLPEGGAHDLALSGVAELVDEIALPYDVLCAPCGTGTTLAGLINAAPPATTIVGFAVMKHAEFLTADIGNRLPHAHDNWRIHFDYHCGGFAETHAELTAFITAFESASGIPLEPVYTGKMMYGLYDLIANDYFKPGSRIIAVHTGGLQGKRGFRP